MHFYTMTIIEESDSEYRSELKLWENTDGNVWIQIGYDDNDPYSTHGIALPEADAVALIKELTRLVGYVPTQEIKPNHGPSAYTSQRMTVHTPTLFTIPVTNKK